MSTSEESPGGTPLYKKYRYMQPHWVGFLRLFGLKTGILSYTLCPFGLELALVFEGTTGVYQCIYRFNSKLARKKRNTRIQNGFQELFCLRSNLSNDNTISA